MMLEGQRSYRELRTRYPSVPSYYARAASFKASSRNEPLHLPKDACKLKKTTTLLFMCIAGLNKGRLWLPLKLRDFRLLENVDFCDSKLLKRDGRFEVHLVVKKEVELNHSYSSVLGVDLGERFTATAVLLPPGTSKVSPKFYGRNIRGIRRKYAYMRRQLGRNKLLKQIRRMRDKEQRAVDDQLHKISRAIVNDAKANNAAIVLGDLKGIRNHARGKRFSRIVSNMPYLKLSQLITYKANWEGIRVFTTSEAYTSKTCHFCNSDGKRLSQGVFRCRACGHEFNADYNGAFNLAARFSAYTVKNGPSGFMAESVPFLLENASSTYPAIS